MELPLCAFCHERRVQRAGKKCCSRACYHASRRKPQRHCRCGRVISKQATQCMECVQVTHRQTLARTRAKALQSNRQKYVERLRERFSQPQTKTQLTREAYNRGYQACWQSFQRAIQRGDVVVVRERRIGKREAA